MITAVLARDDNFAIGFEGQLPWPHNKEDLKFFKNITQGIGNVFMGRSTWESLPIRPLSGRKNYVLSSRPDPDIVDTKFISPENADAFLQPFVYSPNLRLVIIGGLQTWLSYWQYIDSVLMTHIPGEYEADLYFPKELLRDFKMDVVYPLAPSIDERSVEAEHWIRQK